MSHSDKLLMSRRNLLSTALGASALYATGTVPALGQTKGAVPLNNKVLAHIGLNGGPDIRYLLAPPYSGTSGSYGNVHWTNRADVHQVANNGTALAARWNGDYIKNTDSASGTRFGILKGCEWLNDMYRAGNVAFVCNYFANDSRDHDLAIHATDLGDMAAGKLSSGNGWGGRLANAAGGNVVALTQSPRTFCFGPDPARPRDLARVDKKLIVPATNTREYGLYEVEPGQYLGAREYVTRALRNYYAGKRPAIKESSVYFQFMEHERKLRELGAEVRGRLANVPVPPALEALFDAEFPAAGYVATQMLGLYDAIAINDVFNLRVASLEYNGWDTHDNQRDEIEPKLKALFGRGGALDSLYGSLASAARDRLVFVINGEFGRQLKGNGSRGTDHGVGNTLIIIGNAVNGGVYGDMFPEGELARIDEPSPDIEGLTGIDHAFGAVCNWVKSGSKADVFPSASAAPLEAGVNLGSLFG